MRPKRTVQNKRPEQYFFDREVTLGVKAYSYTYNNFLENINKIILQVFSPSTKILDAGCGDGVFTMLCARRVSEVIACDISTKQLAFLQKKKIFNVFPVIADLESNIFKPETFDGIFCSGLLHHFPDHCNALNVLLTYLKSAENFDLI